MSPFRLYVSGTGSRFFPLKSIPSPAFPSREVSPPFPQLSKPKTGATPSFSLLSSSLGVCGLTLVFGCGFTWRSSPVRICF